MGSPSVGPSVISRHHLPHACDFPSRFHAWRYLIPSLFHKCLPKLPVNPPSWWCCWHKPLHATDIHYVAKIVMGRVGRVWPNLSCIIIQKLLFHFNKYSVVNFLSQLRSQTDVHLDPKIGRLSFVLPCGRYSLWLTHRLKRNKLLFMKLPLMTYWHGGLTVWSLGWFRACQPGVDWSAASPHLSSCLFSSNFTPESQRRGVSWLHPEGSSLGC